MNFKWYLGAFNYFISRIFVLVVAIFIMQPFTAYSNEDSYQVTKIAQLKHQLINQPNWQQLVTNPSNKQQHFVIRESGQVYLVDGDEIKPQAILDMSVYQQTDSSLFKLTAIELHPNFSLRDQPGYGIFYTAHIETINKNSKTKRLRERGDDLQLNFDAVITEWQFSDVNPQQVDVNTKREVLRIGVPDNSMVIKQISFNPYVKSWNDDFGLLYVGLTGDNKWPQPLYSGVILRIDPAKFGLHSYTVPNNNPYMDNSQINDAIYLLGGQVIEQFIWPDKNSEHLLVSHQYNNKYLLSLTDSQKDWRDFASKQVLYQSDYAVHDMLIYQERQFPLLRSKLLLLLRQKDLHWSVDSLVFNFSDNQKIRDEKKLQVEWEFTSQQLPANSQLLFNRNNYGEIYLLDNAISVLFRLTQQTLANKSFVIGSGKNTAIERHSSNSNLFILFIILILALLGMIYYWFKRGAHSVKAIVKQQFSALELSESGQQIGLYHRHQSSAETIIDIVNIVSSEIKLNDNSLNIINSQLKHGFSNDKEQVLRTVFTKEKAAKMVDGKVRQVSLLLTDKEKNSYTVCLYMRKGSNRITKKSYEKVIDEVIDWCWFIGGELNGNNIDKRKSAVLPIEKAEKKSKKQSETSLYHQAAAIRPVRKKMENASKPLSAYEISSTLKAVNGHKHLTKTAAENNSKTHSQVSQNNTINTELVNALEKLVSLTQQGFLTMDEFSMTKEKLLKDLLKI
ncbi:MAG: hypothetical protein JKX90_07965 [Colwellia sp.]|jgi:hypothetical protein|nr:hypothetical protein [Colwellia sp.]